MTSTELQPPSVMLMGPPGSGKTDSIITLVEAGLETFVISTEPRGIESLIDSAQRRKIPLDKLHWHTVMPTRPGFARMVQNAKLLATADQKTLANLPPSGGRTEAKWIELLNVCNDFVCQRTGKSYGDIEKFGPDKAVVLDSLSGLNIMSKDITVGDKLLMNQGEWQIAMNQITGFVQSMAGDLKCLFVMIAHVEPEQDATTGATKIMASTLGKRLAPVLPRFFSDVILAERLTTGETETFRWNNAAPGYDLKRRALSLGSNHQPTFRPVVEAFENRRKLIAASAA